MIKKTFPIPALEMQVLSLILAVRADGPAYLEREREDTTCATCTEVSVPGRSGLAARISTSYRYDAIEESNQR